MNLFKKLKLMIGVTGTIIAIAFLFMSVSSGTIAWLAATTDPIVNTFTYGDINITLEETDTHIDDDDNDRTNSYEMLPGAEILKDPLITVKQGSEDCYLFVELTEINDFSKYMEYKVLDGLNGEWEPLINYPNVYYIEVDAKDVESSDLTFEVLENNKVVVKETITKQQLNSLTKETYPKLEIKAYAVQRSDINESINTATKAWELIKN